MTQTHRYYSAEPIDGTHVSLTGSEAHHLLHVMRASPGARVVLFDGRGGQYDAEVVACGRRAVELEVRTYQPADCELAFEVIVGLPLPKGERQRWLIEKLVELGVSRFVPLLSRRSTRKGDRRSVAKLASYVIGAAKQCGRNRLMEIAPACSWQEWMCQPAPRRWIAHFSGQSLAEIDLSESATTRIAVGPEGGFTHEEVARAMDLGWQAVSLGPRTLRMETAALVLATAVGLETR